MTILNLDNTMRKFLLSLSLCFILSPVSLIRAEETQPDDLRFNAQSLGFAMGVNRLRNQIQEMLEINSNNQTHAQGGLFSSSSRRALAQTLNCETYRTKYNRMNQTLLMLNAAELSEVMGSDIVIEDITVSLRELIQENIWSPLALGTVESQCSDFVAMASTLIQSDEILKTIHTQVMGKINHDVRAINLNL